MSSIEFQEIAHTGGKIEFLYDEAAQGISIRISHKNPWQSTMVQLCISYDGKVLDFVPCGGIGAVIPYPQPSFLVFLLSDREGLFGQRCPNCRSYFRSNCISGTTACPYCGKKRKCVEYLTENQLRFLSHFCQCFVTAHNERRSVSIDLDDLLSGMNENRPDWLYPEERQQAKKQCGCGCVYDILGDFGVCPSCAKPNFTDVVAAKFGAFSAQFEDADTKVTIRSDREIEWEKLTRCVSEFEALANVVRMHLSNIPASPKRKNDLNRLSFQRILNAASALKSWFEIDILRGLGEEDKIFLNKMFNRRHIFTHNGGRVDQEYLDNTGDSSVRLN